jgi:crotonobetainyl-CoA:carnitine CoA-transferase CaiB-like acyl-CoA transferase
MASGANETALNGIRVLDFGQYIAGPLSALMLCDQGAEVVRIDPPGGPRWADPANAVLQRGKKSLQLDLKTPEDLESARRLIVSADVLIENFRPGVMDRLGLGYAACEAINPHLIYCSIPGFSKDDPRAGLQGWEGIVSAASGLYTPYSAMRADIPGAGTQPAVTAIPIASNFAAFAAVNAIMAALIARDRIGRGQFVEVSLHAAAFEAINIEAQRAPPPTHNSFHPGADNRFQCADGKWVQLLMIAPRHLAWFVERFLPKQWSEGLGDVDLIRRDADAGLRLRQALADLFKTSPAAHWEQVVNAAGVPLAICQTIDEFLTADPQARAVKAVIELDDPELGRMSQLGYPVTLSVTPARAQGPRRQWDADLGDLLADLPPRPARSWVEATGAPPLKGIRIVDMSQVLAAPTGVRILAELGAEVVKINDTDNWIIGHLQFNSGKSSVLLDIGNPQGRAVLDGLLHNADIFVHNLRPPTAERMGVDEATIRARFPEIVYATVSAYGDRGPKAGYRGWEPVGQAVTGMQLRLGGETPRLARFPLCDFGTGNLLAFAMLLGLWVRLRIGRGQHVQTSLMQAGAYHQSPYMLSYAGQTRREIGGLFATGWGPLNRLYRAVDGWFFLKAPDEPSIARVEGLRPPVSLAGLEAYLEQIFQRDPADIWVQRLLRAGIAAHTMVTVDQAMESDYVVKQGLSIVRDHPGVGKARTIGPIISFSVTPMRVLNPAPAPGWDTRAVLTRLYDDKRANALIEADVAAESLPEDTMIVW